MKRKLQVFVSSTFQDLIEDRQSAVAAILKSGHIPAGMELFTSGDKSQMETIRNWIDESDVYMLILGGRYGSIEPSTGVSYTELEFDYAVEQEKALFSVVINEDTLEARIKEYGSNMMEKDNPKQLGMFREKVLSNISSFFDDSKDIKLCVYESLSDFSSNRDLKGWVSADEVANVQPLLDEINRLNKENENLNEKLSTAERKIGLSSKPGTSDHDFEELVNLLNAININVPQIISGQETDREDILYNVFIANKERFVTGVDNRASGGDVSSFLYHNICPKLQIHGLVVNEKVASVRWRRFSITKKGIDFLAYIDKKELLSSK